MRSKLWKAPPWEIIPAVFAGSWVGAHIGENHSPIYPEPFDTLRKALEGTPYSYQIAVSTTSAKVEIRFVREDCQAFLTSATKHSGVLVFDGARLIASYILPGNTSEAEHLLTVDPNYRGQNLAARAVEQWFRETPGVVGLPTQHIHIVAAKAFCKAHRDVTRWAQETGRHVPPEVVEAFRTGEQQRKILETIERVQASPPAAADRSFV